MDNTSFFFILVSFGGFQNENYENMWGHHRSRIVGVFLAPFNEVLGSTTNILWWYRLSPYEGLCPIFFFRELGFSGSIFVP
jgi:hypothetical protein